MAAGLVAALVSTGLGHLWLQGPNNRLQWDGPALKELIEHLPDRVLPAHLEEALSPYLDDRVFNVIHLIYQTKPHEQQNKDYAFGHIPLREHWSSGRRDMDRTLAHPQWFELPDRSVGNPHIEFDFRLQRARSEQEAGLSERPRVSA